MIYKGAIKSSILSSYVIIYTILISFQAYGTTLDNESTKYSPCERLFIQAIDYDDNNIFLEPITNGFNPLDYTDKDLTALLNYAVVVLLHDYKTQLLQISQIRHQDLNFRNTIEAIENAKVKIYNMYQILELFENTNIKVELSPLNRKKLEELIDFEKELFSTKVHIIYEKYSHNSSLSEQDRLLLDKYHEQMNYNPRKDSLYQNEKTSKILHVQEELLSTKEIFEKFLSTAHFDKKIQYKLFLSTPHDLDDIDPFFSPLELKYRIQQDESNHLYINLSLTELSYILFFSTNETLRMKASNIISKDSFNNLQYDLLTGKIFRLSHLYAKLNGFHNYSEFMLSNTRFSNVNQIYNMLKTSLYRLNTSIQTSKNSLVQPILNTAPHNYRYILNKIKKEISYSYQLYRYLEVNTVIKGILEVFERVFEVKFIARFHSESIRIYDVIDKNTQKLVSTIYMNLHKDEDQSISSSFLSSFKIIRNKTKNLYPIFELNFNLIAHKNSIIDQETLTFDEIFSLFHELGHCFYFILMEPSYNALKDSFLNQDFIEYPSIFMEQLARNKNIARIYLKDYKTQQPINNAVLSKILAIKNIEYFASRIFQLIVSYVDIKSYSTDFDSLDTSSLNTEEFLKDLSQIIQNFKGFPPALKNPPYLRFHTMFSDFYAARCYIYTLAYNLTEYSMEELLSQNSHILKTNIKAYLQNIYKDPNAFIDKIIRQY